MCPRLSCAENDLGVEEEVTLSIWRDGLSYTNGAGHTPYITPPPQPAIDVDVPHSSPPTSTSSGPPSHATSTASASQLLREVDNPFARRAAAVEEEEKAQGITVATATEELDAVLSHEDAEDKLEDAEEKLARSEESRQSLCL